jgi:hippurate hydrolase
MVADGLAEIVPAVDVALAQHILPLPAGEIGTRAGPVLSAAASMRITLYGRVAVTGRCRRWRSTRWCWPQ